MKHSSGITVSYFILIKSEVLPQFYYLLCCMNLGKWLMGLFWEISMKASLISPKTGLILISFLFLLLGNYCNPLQFSIGSPLLSPGLVLSCVCNTSALMLLSHPLRYHKAVHYTIYPTELSTQGQGKCTGWIEQIQNNACYAIFL